MAWHTKSLIFKPSGNFPWGLTHAQVPSALLRDDSIRIYYAGRDKDGRSLTSFIDVARDDPARVIYVHDQPVLPLGEPGTHDQDGAMVGCVVAVGNEVWLYYTGWSREHTVPYRVTVGLAKSTDGGKSFMRAFKGPVIDRTADEPFMTMSPYVLRNADGWHMWYGSGTGWTKVNGKMEPIYITKYAHSDDGLHWQQPDITCIEPLHELEANTRPSVVQTLAGFEMWFSYRHSVDFRGGSGGYRIGHATSKDGLKWQRQSDPEGVTTGCAQWASSMTAYPNVLEYDGKRVMFFNGDGFGTSGFGYALWEE